ncbi:DUF4349 domain-containing protein [Actinocrispum sp. NPDC049592]|uniref:DUF4349 domain-containing protein n=1 Tax=Actinocrispum sp. NPDC049592 TaxID=3154835 RepID=UPI00342093D1
MSRRKSGLLLAGTVLLLGLTACGSSTSGTSAEGNVAAPVPGLAGSPGGAGTPPAAKDGAQQQKPDDTPVRQRQLIQTARMDLAVKNDVSDAAAKARAIATTSGGYTGQEDSSPDRASITLRIPSDHFDSALSQLAELGRVVNQHKQTDDVTEQVVDLDARLSTQRASVDRMRLLLGKASSVAEIAQIESELTRRESDLESLQGRRDALGGKVGLSTVVVSVSKDTAPPPPAGEPEQKSGFLAGLSGGWAAFGDTATAVAETFGVLLPFLVALGIPAGLWLYFRRRRRKPVLQAPLK